MSNHDAPGIHVTMYIAAEQIPVRLTYCNTLTGPSTLSTLHTSRGPRLSCSLNRYSMHTVCGSDKVQGLLLVV
jgi:hypothetical protein